MCASSNRCVQPERPSRILWLLHFRMETAMPKRIGITRTDHTEEGIRLLAERRRCHRGRRRLRAVAGTLTRTRIAELAKVGLQTLRDWVVLYNGGDLDALRIRPRGGCPPKLDGAGRERLAG